MKVNNILKIFMFAGILFFAGNSVFAETGPEAYFKTDTKIFAPGSEFAVAVMIDSNEPINAFDIEIGYSTSTLEFISANNANSIVDFWRGNPQTSEPGIIKLEGGASKPFSGESREIIKLNFRAKNEGSGQLIFNKADVYLADGEGTLAKTNIRPMNLAVSLEAAKLVLGQGDKKPPVIVKAEVVKNPEDRTILAVFNVVDKESGISSVYMREREWILWNNWHVVVNPVKLTAGIWAFELKALDNQGNSAEKIIYIWTEFAKKAGPALIIILGIYFGVKFFFKKKRDITP